MDRERREVWRSFISSCWSAGGVKYAWLVAFLGLIRRRRHLAGGGSSDHLLLGPQRLLKPVTGWSHSSHMLMPRLLWTLTAAAVGFMLLPTRVHREGQPTAGTCEIITMDHDSSQPSRTIARQTARCACRKGQIAGTRRASPACVDVDIIWRRRWCDMTPCLDDEYCDLLVNQSGWSCTQPGGRVRRTTSQVPLTRSQYRLIPKAQNSLFDAKVQLSDTECF
ncbi:hypothetical protein fugu_011959 [Takifugu bimaculatus]|uniref:TAFA chemokine like family member 5 n=1 Tax=Takifugu bimaculatus TaxID=433685 RepID=A0A4Z2C925_9TELE|nr:hypothetical protein fugu_011959 [Takifugu bimaculatus]